MIEIPLKNGSENAHQTVSMRLGDSYLTMEFNFLSYADKPAWAMDVYRDGTPMILGAMLEPNAEVSQGYRAGIGRFFFVGNAVTLDNLGVENHLVWAAS